MGTLTVVLSIFILVSMMMEGILGQLCEDGEEDELCVGAEDVEEVELFPGSSTRYAAYVYKPNESEYKKKLPWIWATIAGRKCENDTDCSIVSQCTLLNHSHIAKAEKEVLHYKTCRTMLWFWALVFGLPLNTLAFITSCFLCGFCNKRCC